MAGPSHSRKTSAWPSELGIMNGSFVRQRARWPLGSRQIPDSYRAIVTCGQDPARVWAAADEDVATVFAKKYVEPLAAREHVVTHGPWRVDAGIAKRIESRRRVGHCSGWRKSPRSRPSSLTRHARPTSCRSMCGTWRGESSCQCCFARSKTGSFSFSDRDIAGLIAEIEKRHARSKDAAELGQ